MILFLVSVDTPKTKEDGTSLKVWEYLFTSRGGQGWFFSLAGITGVVLTFILIVMIIFSQPFVRRKGYFEVRIMASYCSFPSGYVIKVPIQKFSLSLRPV